MTIEELVNGIRRRMNWTCEEAAKAFGFSRTTLWNRLTKTRPKTPFEVSVLACACRLGFATDVIAFLCGQPSAPNAKHDSTLMLAATLFPDLSPAELHALRAVEDTLGGTEPLPLDIVRAIIERLRGHIQHPPEAPVALGGPEAPEGGEMRAHPFA